MPSFSSELRSSFGTPGRACKNLKSLGPTYFVASEASIHSLRAEAAKLARTNKAKFYLHSVLEEKVPLLISLLTLLILAQSHPKCTYW